MPPHAPFTTEMRLVIPNDFIAEWRSQAPWVESAQIEQDLIISRALVEIFSVSG